MTQRRRSKRIFAISKRRPLDGKTDKNKSKGEPRRSTLLNEATNIALNEYINEALRLSELVDRLLTSDSENSGDTVEHTENEVIEDIENLDESPGVEEPNNATKSGRRWKRNSKRICNQG